MGWLYHHRPHDMLGETLYPLSMLETRHPAVYRRQIAKYGDHPSRAGLPDRAIPLLGCRWRDVVFCAPLHPHRLYRALRERDLPAAPDSLWFQIPLVAVQDLPAAIYSGSGRRDPTAPIPPEEVTWLDRERYAELDAVPDATLAWYDRLAREGRVRGSFVGVPHLLVRGPVDVSGARTLRWDEPPTTE